MLRTFAIGDIHGCAQTLKKLLLDELKIDKSDSLYFLGDYIDRGPDSKGVIDFIIQLQKTRHHIFTLRGNHEQLLLDSENDIRAFENWIINGGMASLESFEIARYEELNDEYKAFFNETQFYFESGDFIFVHAGLNFAAQQLFEDKFSMLWIRDMKVDKRKMGNKIIIHGHTPTPLETVKKNLASVNKKGALNIDTGCCLKDYYGYGFLTALDVGKMQLHSIENID